MRAHELSLASGRAGQFAAWHGGLDEGSSIYIQQIDRNGRLTGEPFRVSDGERLAYEPDLLLAEDHLFVVWYEKTADTGRLSARMAGVDLYGQLLWSIPLTDETSQTRNPVIRRIGQDLHVAWIQQSTTTRESEATIWHRRFSLTGAPETPPHQIGRASWNTWNLNATVYETRFIVTYDAAENTLAHELHMLDVTENDVHHRLLSADDGHASLYPDLQVNDAGQAALTWFDERDGNQEIYLLVAPLEALGTDDTQTPRRITDNEGPSIGAYVAWNGTTIGLAWSDALHGSREIFVETFDANARQLSPMQPISRSRGQASVPSIHPSGSGFLVAWNDYESAEGKAHGVSTASAARFKLVAATSALPRMGASPSR